MCCCEMKRRTFLGLGAGMVAGLGLPYASSQDPGPKLAWTDDLWNPERPFAFKAKPLRIQPILMYRVPQRREAASWKSWGGVQTHEAAIEEAARIDKELDQLSSTAGFPMTLLPVAKVTSIDEALRLRTGEHDAVVLYPATGTGELLRTCLSLSVNTVIFVRHRSGPAYYWYEALSLRYLQPRGRENQQDASLPARGVSVDDVVVDDYSELSSRLRALFGVHNFKGARIVALGGAWGKYAPDAPAKAEQQYKLEIVTVSYDDLGKRIRSVMSDPDQVARAQNWTERYLTLSETTLDTDRQFIVNAFLLYGLFKELLLEHNASIFTINSCMGTILPMAKTTACLTLSLLNDEGLVAFCESDFVIIPAGILLHYLSGKPVFLHNSTFPHKAMVTCAHCTAPRRMDSIRYEPVRVVTHFESEYGAAPKVQMPVGQIVTFINPEFATGRWVGMKGTVEDNPFYEICRSQQDVRIHGDWKRLLNEVRDSHWVMVYGDYLQEIEHAARKIGVSMEVLCDEL
jgi:hypothetical protein